MKEETTTQTTEEAPEQPMLPGMEELTAENETLRIEIHIRTAISDIEARLKVAGARSPNLLAKQAKDRFQFDEDGDVTNAEAVIEHLRKAYPEQFTPASIDAAAGRQTRPTLTKEALAKMTIPEVQQLDWNEVRSALQGK